MSTSATSIIATEQKIEELCLLLSEIPDAPAFS
jgi:hypothetical protein